MARARDPARDKAKEMYLASNGEMLLKDIAERLNKGEGTVRGWKNKDAWDEELNGTLQSNERNAPIEIDAIPVDEREGRVKKRSGNPNPKNRFTNRNTMSVKHGFYRQFLPLDMLEIIEETEDLTIADRLYFQIETKFAALIQLHKIMFVNNRGDTLRDVSGSGESTTYKVVYAFEQFAEYIKTEARLTAEWRNVVKQYLELADEYDERRMKIEQMRLSVEKTKMEIEKTQAEIASLTGVEEEQEITFELLPKKERD